MSINLPEPELAWLAGLVEQNADQEVYLVGGAVRDILLGRPRRDYDLVVPNDPRPLARKIARRLNGAWFILDHERLTTRIVHPDHGKPERIIDIAAIQGGSLEADLHLRDFTVNALAVNLRQPHELIDPCGGVHDLNQKILRLCSANSMQDDPIRILRGIRLAVELGYRMYPTAIAAMHPVIPRLAGMSPERLRDEFFRMLDNPQPSSALRVMKQLGILATLMPELDILSDQAQGPPHVWNVWDHTLAAMEILESLLTYLSNDYPADGAGNLWLGLAVAALSRYRSGINEVLETSLNPFPTLVVVLRHVAARFWKTGGLLRG